MCVAAGIIMFFNPQPVLPRLSSGLPVFQQISLGLAIGGAYYLVTVLGLKHAGKLESFKSTADSYNRLNLNGWNPLWIALAAGIGEELLFRGALQPVIGVWLTSVLFVLAHTRAYRFDGISRRVLIQAAGVFAVSMFLGFVAQYIGLFAAMTIHTAIDVVGLYAIRRMSAAAVPAN
jgi:membrane protease YdiL (CAAX protease family)